ncbi:MAG: sulfatase-like hydrolase/transferase [Asticcacaulis sp.]
MIALLTAASVIAVSSAYSAELTKVPAEAVATVKEAVTPSHVSDTVVPKAQRSNVLVLLFDDMRFDSFSYRGGPVPTPNIDALAAHSTQFNTAMATVGLCSPARATLFTGEWGNRTGLDDNVQLWHSRLNEMNPNQSTIIDQAVKDGYFVGFVGKWHLGALGPIKRGAQYVKIYEGDAEPNIRMYTPYDDAKAIEGYKEGKTDANGEKWQYYHTLPGTYEDTDTAEKVRDGVAFLKEAATDKRPFFGVISFTQPHPPYRNPEPYASMFDPAKIVEPANFLSKDANKPLSQREAYWPWHDVSHMSESDWRKAQAHYYGSIAMLDRAVGDIIAAAKAAGVWDNLRVIFTSDQGSMMGEHGLYDKAPYAYDELMRIPLLIRDPNIKPRVVTRHVSTIDLEPTMAKWMGLKADGPVDGKSLIPLMEQGDSAVADKDDLATYDYEWYNGAWFGLRAIRTPDYKFVWNPGDSIDELYDLKKDPGEMTNQIKNPAYASVLKDLRERLVVELQKRDDASAKTLQAQYPEETKVAAH